MTIQSRLDDILKRCEAATTGPWVPSDTYPASSVRTKAEGLGERVFGYGHGGQDFICDLNDGEYHSYSYEQEQVANAEFIAHARQDLPLIVQALQKAVEYVKNETCICESIEQYVCERCDTLTEISSLLGAAAGEKLLGGDQK